MKKILIAAFAWLLIPSAYLSAQPLAGTDELGRTLPQNDETGDPKSDRQVGMFCIQHLTDSFQCNSAISGNLFRQSLQVNLHEIFFAAFARTAITAILVKACRIHMLIEMKMEVFHI